MVQSNSPLSVAIIGAGKIAGMFANPLAKHATTHAQAISNCDNLNLVGIVDSDEEKAQVFADRWAAPNAFSSVDELLDTVKCDLIAICSPDETHAEILRHIIGHNTPPRFVAAEKPLCTTPDQLASIEIDMSTNKHIKVALNHVRRFDTRHQTLAKMISDETWGHLISAHWVYYGGWLHTGVHVIDTLQMLLGDTLEIKEVNLGFKDRINDPSLELRMNISSQPGAPIHIESFPESAFQLFEGEIRFKEGRIRFLNFGEEVYIDEVRVNDIGERELAKTQVFNIDDVQTPMEKLYDQASNWLKNGDIGILDTVNLASASQIMKLLFTAKSYSNDNLK